MIRQQAILYCQNLYNCALENAKKLTGNGKNIDDYQVIAREIAQLSTQLVSIKSLQNYLGKSQSKDSVNHDRLSLINDIFLAETLENFRAIGNRCYDAFGLSDPLLDYSVALASWVRENLSESKYRQVGLSIIDKPDNNQWIASDSDGKDEAEIRDTTRRFGRDVVMPEAEAIHRQDLLVPEKFLTQMAELGFFGMSIPTEFGGVGLSYLMMVLVTEELSAASLPAAGSIITRPEILSRALLKGGTQKQQEKWLEPIANGEIMVAISVTEPNVGSDVASVSCRATETTQNDKQGYLLNGAKAWCTFAGRADVLALLARTGDNGHKGLSLFIVEKDSFTGHEFEMQQPEGGKLNGKAIDTMGYRGMHSFVLQFDDYFVPAENMVGEEGGKGKGFYYQMNGFAIGRLQTAGRAIGLGQAALETTVKYASERPQFGKALVDFQNTQYNIGKMAVSLEASRQLSYAAAQAMDAGRPDADIMASQAKLLACRMAVTVAQQGQLIHGGWGYAEEYDISRYVADSLVLPIFEGVEPILEIKVIGRGLLAS